MDQPAPSPEERPAARRRSHWRASRRARPALRAAAGLALLAAIWGPVWSASGPGPRAIVLDGRRSFAPRRPAARDRITRLDRDASPAATLHRADDADTLLQTLDRAIEDAGRRGGDVVFASSGLLPVAALLDLAARARSLGVPIHVLCPPEPETPLAAVEAVRGPRRVRPGETVRLEATVAWNGWIAPGERAASPQTLRVELRSRAGRVLDTAAAILPASGGRQRVALTAQAADLIATEGDLAVGAVRLRAPWQPADGADGASPRSRSPDPVPSDDARVWAAWVEPAPRTALWVRGPDAPGPGTLTKDARIRIAEPAALPLRALDLAPYRVVFLDGVPAAAVPPGATSALRDFVEAGGGLLVCGARHAFGPGGYAGTELGALLPVESRPGGEAARPLALSVCLDRSGSMAQPSAPGRSKLRAAIEAVLGAASRLGRADRLAVVSFAAGFSTVWPLATVEPARAPALQAALEQLLPEGATDLYPALLASIDTLRGADVGARAARHVLVVSDGRSDATPDPEKALREVLRALGQEGAPRVTVSVVAVGREADAARLGQLARAGRGRLLLASEGADAIERAIRQEADPRRLELLAPGPRALAPGPRWDRLGGALDAAPLAPVSAAARTRARDGAEVLVSVPEVGPALAIGRRGAGRVATLPIEGGPPRTRLLAAAWTIVDRAAEEGRVRWELVGTERSARARVRIELGAEAALKPHVVRVRIGGARLEAVEEVGPGIYEASAPSRRGAPALLSVEVDGAVAIRGVLPARTETASTAAPDRALLRALAERTGGEQLSVRRAPLPRRRAGSATPIPLRPWLALAAALFFVFDLAAPTLAHLGTRQ